MNGKWIWWYENGQKSFEGTFKDGKEVGLRTYWDKNDRKVYKKIGIRIKYHWIN